MPNFYQRPLTWLFWIAALCLDAVALSIDYEGRLASALVLGQLFVVSGWLAVGRSPLVMRAACLVAASALITAPDYVIPRWRSDMHQNVVWPHVLAMTMVGAAITAMATAMWAAVLRGISPLKQEGSPPIRFSVASCLGWMLVVAVASSGLRVADFSLLLDQPLGVLSGFGMAGFAAALIAGSLADYRATALTRGLNVVAILGMALLIVFDLRPPMASPERLRAAREAMPVLWGCLAFAAAWILVMRLDERRSAAASAIAPREPQLDHRATPALRLLADER